MPLRWKTTELQTPEGKVKVTHWEKHDPRELLVAINAEPIRRIEGDSKPRIAVHKFGPHELAVRRFRRPCTENYHDPEELFATLRDMIGTKSAIVEMPVAFIEPALLHHYADKYKIVTLWKKNTRNLRDFLNDSDIDLEKKKRAMVSAVRKMAQLHAFGFLHGHLNPTNFVTDEKGNAMFVDYTFLTKNPRAPSILDNKRRHNFNTFFYPLSMEVYKENAWFRRVRANVFANKLQREYKSAHAKYITIAKRNKAKQFNYEHIR